MATAGRGDPSSSSRPFQKTNGNSSHNHETGYIGGQMRLKLQALLDDKERQLQKAEALGQRILAQQMELEERINQITELDEQGGGAQNEDGDSEMRSQLDELAQTMHGWATENDSLWTGAVTKVGQTPHVSSVSCWLTFCLQRMVLVILRIFLTLKQTVKL